MTTMRCVVVREHGGFDKLRLEERPIPTPGPGQVRVKLAAIGLNHLDTWVRRGVPGHTFPLPQIPSSDGCGVVDAAGHGVTNCKEGDAVVVLPGVSCGVCVACLLGQDNLCRHYHILGESCDGLCAEHAVVPAANVAPKPRALSAPEAASICLVFQTAWHMLVRRAELRAGETVLVHAGLSGVGSAAVQIANVLGAQVIATAGGAEKCAKVKALGAHHVIDHRTQDVAATVRALTGKAGVQVVFEHTGAATFDASLKCLARGATAVLPQGAIRLDTDFAPDARRHLHRVLRDGGECLAFHDPLEPVERGGAQVALADRHRLHVIQRKFGDRAPQVHARPFLLCGARHRISESLRGSARIVRLQSRPRPVNGAVKGLVLGALRLESPPDGVQLLPRLVDGGKRRGGR